MSMGKFNRNNLNLIFLWNLDPTFRAYGIKDDAEIPV